MNTDLRRKFTVAPPQTYDSYPLTAPEAQPGKAGVGMRALIPTKSLGAKSQTAVWVVHGMGQQVPFATLEQVAEGIIAAAGDANVKTVQFREVKVGATVLQRVELVLKRSDGSKREVHVYECYWAPKTEGVVKLRNVIDFLWDGGSRGLINSVFKFQRALFGAMARFRIPFRTPLYLLVALATLAALVVINAIILAMGASAAGLGNHLGADVSIPLKVIALLVCAAAITFGVVLLVAESSRPALSKSFWGHTIRNLTWFGVAFTILSIVAGAALMASIFWCKWPTLWLKDAAVPLQTLSNLLILVSLLLALASRLWRRLMVSRSERPGIWLVSQAIFYLAVAVHFAVLVGAVFISFSLGGSSFASSQLGHAAAWFPTHVEGFLTYLLGAWGQYIYKCQAEWLGWPGWVWPFLAIISSQVRTLLVQYVGDVTAYVASNKVDCFDELRAKIKALAKQSLTAVYSAKAGNSEKFEYDRVCVVGHSLGSVIAYDTLNRLIADDRLASVESVKDDVKELSVPPENLNLEPVREGPARIVTRTQGLLTFGSPLDKTAFFFSVMGKNTHHIREQLAAVVQPLIEDVQVREKIEWVNVFSRNDIISGPLKFYEFPTPVPIGVQQVIKVVNVEDEDALVPLIAHVEYWTNPTVWKQLLLWL